MGGRGRSGSAFRGYDFFSFHKATTHLSSTNIDSAKQANTEARASFEFDVKHILRSDKQQI